MLSDKKLHNWLKCALGLQITKEGLLAVVIDEMTNFQQTTFATINVTQNKNGLPAGTKCTQCSLQNILACPTTGVCSQKKKKKCDFHDSPANQPKPNLDCPNKICDAFRDSIRDKHRYYKSPGSEPSWINTQAMKWCTDPFSIAKCFMSRDGYTNIATWQETDFNGVINVMINYKDFQNKIADKLNLLTNICCQAREVGRKVRHSPSLSIEDVELNDYFATLTNLLSDKKVLAKDTNAQEAVNKLKQLQNDTLVIRTDDLQELLKSAAAAVIQNKSDETDKMKADLLCAIKQQQQFIDDKCLCIKDSGDKILADLASALSKSVKDMELLGDTQLQRLKAEGLRIVDVMKTERLKSVNVTKAIKTITSKLSSETKHVINSQPSESYSFEETRNFLQRDLIHHYRKICSEFQISPLFDEADYELNLLEIHVQPTLRRMELLSDKRQNMYLKSMSINSYHDVFVKNSKTCQHIYISAPAGCGKTSYAKRMALAWCQAHQPIEADNKWFNIEDLNEIRHFHALFVIFLRESHECECDIDQMIQTQLLNDLAKSYTYSNFAFLQTLLSDEKCLIIMDGLDEWSHPKNCRRIHSHIPHSRARSLCTILTTTRPWKLDIAALKSSELDQKLELSDLDDDLLNVLIDRVVEQLNSMYDKQMKAEDFIMKVKSMKLTDLRRIPVIVMQLLTLWFDGEPLGQSQCEIYCNMIEFFLKRYCIKHVIDFEVCDKPAPVCFEHNIHLKAHMDLLSKLGGLAFHTLFSDIQESTLIFDMAVATKYMKREDIDMCRNVGLLSQEKVTKKVSERKSKAWFFHKTFQEFLAALYVTLNPDKVADAEATILRICCSVEKILEMSKMLEFMYGLCPEVMFHLCEPLRQVVSADSRTEKYRTSCELMMNSYNEETQVLRQLQYTMMNWLHESWSNNHQNVAIPLSDVNIDDSDVFRWSEVLKYLVVNNPLCSLSAGGDGLDSKAFKEIVNSVTLVSSIRKLYVHFAPGPLIDMFLSQHKESPNVKSETWNHLEFVTLRNVVVHLFDETFCSIVDSIIQMCRSVKVKMTDCIVICTDTTRDWRHYILSHSLLTFDYNILNEISKKYTYIKLLQFHTRKEGCQQKQEVQNNNEQGVMYGVPKEKDVNFASARMVPSNETLLKRADVDEAKVLQPEKLVGEDTSKVDESSEPTQEVCSKPEEQFVGDVETGIASGTNIITMDETTAEMEEQLDDSYDKRTELPRDLLNATQSEKEQFFKCFPATSSETHQSLLDSGLYSEDFHHEDNPWHELAGFGKGFMFVSPELLSRLQDAKQDSENEEECDAQGILLQLPDLDVEGILNSDDGQRVLNMGYEPIIIKDAIKTLFNNASVVSTETIIDKVLEIQETSSQTSPQILTGVHQYIQMSNEEVEKILLSDTAQSILQMGYQQGIVRHAVEVLLRKRVQTISVEALMEKVLQIEDNYNWNSSPGEDNYNWNSSPGEDNYNWNSSPGEDNYNWNSSPGEDKQPAKSLVVAGCKEGMIGRGEDYCSQLYATYNESKDCNGIRDLWIPIQKNLEKMQQQGLVPIIDNLSSDSYRSAKDRSRWKEIVCRHIVAITDRRPQT